MTEPHALVTGAAGFIGSHLVERLLASGTRVTGVDGFTDYYDPALKRANLAAAAGGRRASACSSWTWARPTWPRCPRSDVVFHLAAQPGVRASWGARVRHLRPPQRARHPAAARALPRRAGCERFVYASSSSVYGDAERYPTRRGPAAAAVLALRRHQARGRAPGAALRPQLRPAGRWRCATSRSTARASARTWPSTASAARCCAARPSRSTATARSRATSPSSPTRSRPPSSRGSAAAARRSTTSAAARRSRCARPIALLERLLGVKANVRHEPTPPGDPLRTRADATRLRAALGMVALGRHRAGARGRGRVGAHALRGGTRMSGADGGGRRGRTGGIRITAVIPAWNEAESLPELQRELAAVARRPGPAVGGALHRRRLARRHGPGDRAARRRRPARARRLVPRQLRQGRRAGDRLPAGPRRVGRDAGRGPAGRPGRAAEADRGARGRARPGLGLEADSGRTRSPSASPRRSTTS